MELIPKPAGHAKFLLASLRFACSRRRCKTLSIVFALLAVVDNAQFLANCLKKEQILIVLWAVHFSFPSVRFDPKFVFHLPSILSQGYKSKCVVLTTSSVWSALKLV